MCHASRGPGKPPTPFREGEKGARGYVYPQTVWAAAEAEATREARAKVIAAEGEQKASRALKEASDIISESPAALQLRYLQTLSNISAEKNSTIIFPLPIELMKQFAPK